MTTRLHLGCFRLRGSPFATDGISHTNVLYELIVMSEFQRTKGKDKNGSSFCPRPHVHGCDSVRRGRRTRADGTMRLAAVKQEGAT